MVYARKQLGFERLYALVQEDNPRSIKLLERCGFVPHSSLTLEGESLPVHLFEVKL
jgi:RimJ/RimL family protein N-acetyltransferase